MIRKIELLIFCLLCLIFLILSGVVFIFGKSGTTVCITENGKTQIYSIRTDKVVRLSHNTVVIKDGKVFMDSADCPNRICVNSGKISEEGEQIACIPNGVLVEIKK